MKNKKAIKKNEVLNGWGQLLKKEIKSEQKVKRDWEKMKNKTIAT